MKTKPILIGVASVLILVCVCFFVFRKNSNKPAKSEVSLFLTKFNTLVKAGDTDSLMMYFEKTKDTKTLKKLLNLISGRADFAGNKKLLGYVALDVDASDIKIISADIVNVSVPLKLTHDSLDSKPSKIFFKIHKIGSKQFKILHYDAKKLLADYLAYEEYVRVSTKPVEAFSAATLAAFKIADQLKTRYDSVIWFAHYNNKTYFYVVKGKWAMDKDIDRPKDSVIDEYKMGLVGPDLKEIVPPEYDLIHNINGTFDGMVEVEKDNKKGFFDLDGKNVLPANYDQVFPIEDDANLAVLRNGSDYFYFKKDKTVSEKADIKISDFFSKIKNLTNSFDLYKNALSVVTEYNSMEEGGAIYIPPSYLVDLNMISKWEDFKNPLRNDNRDENIHENYKVARAESNKASDNWLEAAFYSVRDYFLGGRSEFYDKKNLVIVDKRKNRILTEDILVDYSREEDSGAALVGTCDINNIRPINDSLFEVKIGAEMEFELYDSTKFVEGGTHYNYLAIKDNKLVELPNDRYFGFTKYVKMDDSYLSGCYNLSIQIGSYDNRKKIIVDHITPEMLRYMKNEIYADYRYAFKDKRWENVFIGMQSYSTHYGDNTSNNKSVDDSLTAIDKYNINWINQKLNGVKPKAKANTLAAK